MTRKRFHGLKRIKVRPTWNKYNLFNLSRLRIPSVLPQTYYQQKWGAKSMTRAYHGEHIREKHWQRIFRSRLQAVIPMDHRYLAEHDGSELSAGRGSGRDRRLEIDGIRFGRNHIPYMNMTYAPAERRLDMAVWRALFASSARQARQFVIHGNVKVNGKKMPYPGYLLNPGDMFQVEIDRVLYATGAPKELDQVRRGRVLRKKIRRSNRRAQPRKRGEKARRLSATKLQVGIEETSENMTTPRKPTVLEATDIEEIRKQRKLDLKELLTQAQTALEDRRNRPSAKRKQELRAFTKDVKNTMAHVNKKSSQALDEELNSLVSQLSLANSSRTMVAPAKTPEQESASRKLSPEEQRALREAIVQARENPIDESKPYATPWRPRPYMSPFAFIPRYLEVNHNICAAVYLRHPVARPSLAEVPSPFPAETHQLAFNWYLRRR